MSRNRTTASDTTWKEQADQNPSILGAFVVLAVLAFPMVLL